MEKINPDGSDFIDNKSINIKFKLLFIHKIEY